MRLSFSFCIVAEIQSPMFSLLSPKTLKRTSRRDSPWLPAPAPRRRGGPRSSCSSLGGLRRPFLEQRERGENEKTEREKRKKSQGRRPRSK